jgi:copper ion binding protein
MGIPKVKALHHQGSMTMHEIRVDGMSCNHCVSKVTRAVRTIDELAKVDVQLAAKTVLVESDADVDDLIAAISDAGYAAQVSNIG